MGLRFVWVSNVCIGPSAEVIFEADHPSIFFKVLFHFISLCVFGGWHKFEAFGKDLLFYVT